MRRILFVVCCLSVLSSGIYARSTDTTKRQSQFSNFVKISHGAFLIPDWNPAYKPLKRGTSWFDLSADAHNIRCQQFQMLGISYERRILKNLFLGGIYMEWYDLFHYRGEGPYTVRDPSLHIRHQREVQERLDYKMADLYAFYKWNISHSKHFINVGAGASYCWGNNYTVATFYLNPDPPYDAVTTTDFEKVHYWGIMPLIGYDFFFMHNHLNIGPDIRARFYKDRSPAEYDFNFHLGVNF